MSPSDVLTEGFGRVLEGVDGLVHNLDPAHLTARVTPQTNTIAWLVWHIARVQDAQIAQVCEAEEIWTSQGYVDRFGLPFAPQASGYGQSADEVGQVDVPADLLLDYLQATHDATMDFLSGLSESDLDRVVDSRWDPPVTLGVRLVSILDDDVQHLGQASFLAGILRSA
ncbi:MAG: mycothiol transferase [Nocardioides sp.]